ncbi:MAG: serine hydrolase [Chitinophagales bacterium]
MKALKLKETWLAIALAFIAGYTAAYFLASKTAETTQQAAPPNSLSEFRSNSGFKYINPLIECDNYLPENNASVAVLTSEIQSYLSELRASQEASHVSVYYRDLNNGSWLGINEDERYSPASLLKVPIMIAALKRTEKDPTFLQKKIKFENYIDEVTANIIDTGLVEIGKSYTIEELIFKMIAYSDNEAKNLILHEIGDPDFNQTFIDAGIAPPDFRYTTDVISVKEFSSFFRVLYNATYLNKEMSEKALSILSNVNFKRGIVAGLPQGITVAHKFGERAYNDTNIKQLHDCGIVYIQGKPYLICIMTRGANFDALSKVIAKISGIVHSNVIANQ